MSTLHGDILCLLAGADERGLPLGLLLSDLRRGRHGEIDDADAVRALRDLADKSFVDAFISPLGRKRWRITPLGAGALREEGL